MGISPEDGKLQLADELPAPFAQPLQTALGGTMSNSTPS